MYQVLWERAALDELADLWLASNSARRARINAAVNRADQLLRSDPQNQGESREGNERVLFVPPLGVLFEVEQNQPVVHVLQVWLFH